ncbi:NYN domain-containing protein [Corynebacterium mastitidis]|uniref:NYN domain-containing protein n=1 Tax=Corynebacterium mastitidis TaxID=161890 RepID=UPI00254DE489|nr:NYN domain-containing protein [Corynebacterium mastitidis]MDK8450762.1 NYN domain-containing protein [Corynebacterium mastitidis]
MTHARGGERVPPLRPITTAILIDGGFYRKRAAVLFGKLPPEARARELLWYCHRHVEHFHSNLYRIFYYDCAPSERVVYHPLTRRQVNLSKSTQHEWMTRFLRELSSKRKVAIRRGEELHTQGNYALSERALKKLCRGEIGVADLSEDDFYLAITQKGVDMKLGIDIVTLAEQRLVNQIVMISGDSDFVPAAKHARRLGIDFVVDPMWARIAESLGEHIDGIWQGAPKPGLE